MTREVPLSRGLVALVDDWDFDDVVQFGKWYANPSCCTFYARKNFWRDGRCFTITMHAVITGWGYVDHRDGNGLNNTRANLRPANDSLNSKNRGLRSDNASGFKGVHRHRDGKRWVAKAFIDGRSNHLGIFPTAEAAARAYDSAALTAWGEFARLNFSKELHHANP